MEPEVVQGSGGTLERGSWCPEGLIADQHHQGTVAKGTAGPHFRHTLAERAALAFGECCARVVREKDKFLLLRTIQELQAERSAGARVVHQAHYANANQPWPQGFAADAFEPGRPPRQGAPHVSRLMREDVPIGSVNQDGARHVLRIES